MSRRKVPVEAQIIALFTSLSDESKRMVMFGLNAIMQQYAPQPQKREKKANKQPLCAVCGYFEDNVVHDMTYISSHPFAGPGTAPPVKRRSRRQSTSTTPTPSIEADAASAMTASGD